MNPVFIIGSGRCGSSWITEVLCRHPDTAFISNIDDRLDRLGLRGRWNGPLYRSPLGRFTEKGGVRFAPSEAYRLMAREVSPIYADSCRDLTAEDATPWLAARTRAFFERRAAVQGGRVFVHKYTGWPRIGFFHAAFPEARFLHIVRDGRAVANSWLQMPWWQGYRGPEQWHWGPLAPAESDEWRAGDRSFVLLAGLLWRRLMEAHEAAAASLPDDRVLTVRYEDVLARPVEGLRRMTDFAGLDWDESMNKLAGDVTPRADRRDAFRRDLSASQIKALDGCLGERLARLGYAP